MPTQPHACCGPSGAWRTVAMVCAVVPPISPACVTWAGHPTCPCPHPPQAPLPPAAPGTVAAASIATAASGALASVTSAKVSGPRPDPLGRALGKPPWDSRFLFSVLASLSPHPLPVPDPRWVSVPPASLAGPQSPLWDSLFLPNLGFVHPPLKQPCGVRDQLNQFLGPLPRSPLTLCLACWGLHRLDVGGAL